MTKKLTFLVVGLLVSLMTIQAQNGFINYVNKNDVTSIAIDNNEKLWLATTGGVVKMDLSGNLLESFTTSDGLSENYITTISVDIDNNIWVGTDRYGISYFNGTEWNISSNTGQVKTSFVANDGKIWFGTFGSGVYVYENIENYTEHYTSSNSGLESSRVFAINQDNDGVLWFGYSSWGSNGGLTKFDGTNWESFKTSNSDINSDNINCIDFDNSGNIWIGSADNGICTFNGTNWTTYNTSNSNLANDKINSLYFDENNILWIGTAYGGISKFDGINWTTYNSNNIESNNVPKITGLNNKIYFCYGADINNPLKGITTFDNTDFTTFTIPGVNIPNNYIQSIASDATGVTWIATNGGVCKAHNNTFTVFNSSNSPITDFVLDTDVDIDNSVWLCNYSKIFNYNGTDWTEYNSSNTGVNIFAIEVMGIDNQGNKWFGTTNYDGGVVTFDGTNWTEYNTDNSDLPTNFINDFAWSSNGDIWIATREGLAIFNGTNWTILNTTNSNIPFDHIYSIAIDENDNVYIGGSSTTSVYNGTNWETIDGIYNTVKDINIAYNNDVWFATYLGGIIKYDGYSTESYQVPNGIISDYTRNISFNNNNVMWVGTRYGISTLDIEIPVISSTHNDQTVEANNNCEANLPDYTSDVIATDNCDTDIDVTQTPMAGTIISGYTNTVTLTVTDDAGNTDEVTFNVEVMDITDPEITSIHNNLILGDGSTCEEILTDYTSDVLATDNCDDNLDITQTPMAGTIISGYTNTVTLTVTDDAGNTDEVTFNVEVMDITDPEITSIHNNLILGDGSTCEEILTDYTSDVLATDNCDANLDITQLPTAGTIISGATNTITLIATDDAGNTNEVTFNVEVADNTNPETPTLADLTGECSVTATAPTTTDNCAEIITGTTSNSTEYTEQGTYVITWNFADGNGNDINVNQNVIVEDNTSPTISCIDNQIIDLAENQTIYTVSGTEFDPTETNDNCEVASIVNDFNNTETLTNAELPGGTTTINWTITDIAGNTANCSFEATVNVEFAFDLESNISFTIPESVFSDIPTSDRIFTIELTNGNSIPVWLLFEEQTLTFSGTTPNEYQVLEIIVTVSDGSKIIITYLFTLIIGESTNINNLTNNGISIYPNPTKGIINFEFADNNIQQITISDITGKIIIEKSNIQRNKTIDLSNFANGIYIISIQTDNEIFTTKIVKE